MFNSATSRCSRSGRASKQGKPQESDVRWIFGFVVIGAILGALTSGVDLPFSGNAPVAQTASTE